jgi:hypothetical protein
MVDDLRIRVKWIGKGEVYGLLSCEAAGCRPRGFPCPPGHCERDGPPPRGVQAGARARPAPQGAQRDEADGRKNGSYPAPYLTPPDLKMKVPLENVFTITPLLLPPASSYSNKAGCPEVPIPGAGSPAAERARGLHQRA